jgi:hypothetical protein
MTVTNIGRITIHPNIPWAMTDEKLYDELLN